MSTASAEDIRKHVRIYMGVFAALMILTVVTVGVSYLHLSVGLAVTVALIVASVKGALVALFFMHLSNEKRMIYGTLILTAAFFVFLMFLPLFGKVDQLGKPLVHETPPATGQAAH